MAIHKKLGTAELLFKSAQQLGLQPSWIVPRGLFAITQHGTETYVYLSRSPLNSHTAISLASNKHLTRLVLERHQLPNIPFIRPQSHAEAGQFLEVHKRIIAKPLNGWGGRDIHIVSDPAQLQPLTINHYILEKYITGPELRYLVLDGAVIGVHRSEYGTSVAEDRHLERFSLPAAEWNATLVAQTLQIARIMDLRFAAIDYLIDDMGTPYILEVNSAPGLKWFHAPTAGPPVDVATLFLTAILDNRPTSLPHVVPEPTVGLPLFAIGLTT